ncbi:hypothetical protein Taro_039272, partial [Colocasia esculenta]|nr:hypothetical protein [Colocasia esculenta]
MMSSLSIMAEKQPPGFRFHPRDDELISGYLAGRISGDRGGFPAMIVDVDLNKYEPWALPQTCCVGHKEWYFYSLSNRKYASGLRMNRATVSGYWKATGKDRPVELRRGGLLGMRKTLVFYHGRAPTGKKTSWVMHEFRLEASTANATAVDAGPTSFSSFKVIVLLSTTHNKYIVPFLDLLHLKSVLPTVSSSVTLNPYLR